MQHTVDCVTSVHDSCISSLAQPPSALAAVVVALLPVFDEDPLAVSVERDALDDPVLSHILWLIISPSVRADPQGDVARLI